MKKLIAFVIIVGALGTGGWAYYQNRSRPEPTVSTVPVTRGDVVERVQATGTLEAVTTVDVGTQVSGVVQDLYADFNDIVKEGTDHRAAGPVDPPGADRIAAGQRHPGRSRPRTPAGDARGREAEARSRAGDVQEGARAQDRPRGGRDRRQERRSPDQVLGGQPDPVARQPEPGAGQPELHRHHLPHRRHRDLAQRRPGPDGRVEHERADALRHRRRPDQDAGRRQHRRVGRRQDAARARRCRSASTPTPPTISSAAVQQVRLQPAVVQNVVVYSTVIAVPESAAEAEARHDGDRRHRDRAPQQRAARADRGGPVPADRSDVHGAQPARAPGSPARPRRLRWRTRPRVAAVDETAARARADRAVRVDPVLDRCAVARRPRRAAPAGHTASPTSRRSRARTGAAGPGRTAPGWRRTSCAGGSARRR